MEFLLGESKVAKCSTLIHIYTFIWKERPQYQFVFRSSGFPHLENIFLSFSPAFPFPIDVVPFSKWFNIISSAHYTLRNFRILWANTQKMREKEKTDRHRMLPQECFNVVIDSLNRLTFLKFHSIPRYWDKEMQTWKNCFIKGNFNLITWK